MTSLIDNIVSAVLDTIEHERAINRRQLTTAVRRVVNDFGLTPLQLAKPVELTPVTKPAAPELVYPEQAQARLEELRAQLHELYTQPAEPEHGAATRSWSEAWADLYIHGSTATVTTDTSTGPTITPVWVTRT